MIAPPTPATSPARNAFAETDVDGDRRPNSRNLLYDGRRFDGSRLHRAIVRRGWTLRSFAEATGRGHFPPLSETTIRDACRGKGTHDSTAIRIFQALVERQPVVLPEDDVPS